MKSKFEKKSIVGLLTAIGWSVAASVAVADTAPPSYNAFPEVYKLLQENEQFRVVEATWKPGQKDTTHSHLPFVIYFLTDCHLLLETPDGRKQDTTPKAGANRIWPAVDAHTAQNIGKDMCRAVLVERKG